jgi:hypothetical protein
MFHVKHFGTIVHGAINAPGLTNLAAFAFSKDVAKLTCCAG